jgi:hypothetical protein
MQIYLPKQPSRHQKYISQIQENHFKEKNKNINVKSEKHFTE